MRRKMHLLWVLIIAGFAVIEFPGIFFINRIEPTVFGLPFIYGFTLIMWFYLCVLMFIGYKLKWGFGDSEKTGKSEKQ